MLACSAVINVKIAGGGGGEGEGGKGGVFDVRRLPVAEALDHPQKVSIYGQVSLDEKCYIRILFCNFLLSRKCN